MALLSTAAICFIACHGGSADHFATFAEVLKGKGHQVQIYASGPALKKLQDRQFEAISFSCENGAAAEVAKKCSGAIAIITDVGNDFDVVLHKALSEFAPKSLRFAYYDNPEAYVPGGYSATAAKVMGAAQKVLFANANLAQTPLYDAPHQEIDLPYEKRVGLGYYPLSQGEKIALRRSVEGKEMRARIFSRMARDDRGEKIWVYAGGNNEEYFSEAFPAFLRFLSEASLKKDLSDSILVLQQHPAAKEKNRDGKLLQEWTSQQGSGAPLVWFSDLNSEDIQVAADAMIYYQTSMGPQFVLAGIPTIQAGHEPYEDVLVRNGLCSTATDADQFLQALARLKTSAKGSAEAVREGLGIFPDWDQRLERALSLK